VSAPSSQNPQWHAHVERLRRLSGAPPRGASASRHAVVGAVEARDAVRGEWTATPPGRLGRRLLADVEPYLEFFAVAHRD
jgi:hypothetical protein